MIYYFYIRTTILTLHTITKVLEICIDINILISVVDRYTWIFTSRNFELALAITFKYFSMQMAYELLSVEWL